MWWEGGRQRPQPTPEDPHQALRHSSRPEPRTWGPREHPPETLTSAGRHGGVQPSSATSRKPPGRRVVWTLIRGGATRGGTPHEPRTRSGAHWTGISRDLDGFWAVLVWTCLSPSCLKGRVEAHSPRRQHSLSLAWTHHHPQAATTCEHFSVSVARGDKAAQPEEGRARFVNNMINP